MGVCDRASIETIRIATLSRKTCKKNHETKPRSFAMRCHIYFHAEFFSRLKTIEVSVIPIADRSGDQGFWSSGREISAHANHLNDRDFWRKNFADRTNWNRFMWSTHASSEALEIHESADHRYKASFENSSRTNRLRYWRWRFTDLSLLIDAEVEKEISQAFPCSKNLGARTSTRLPL